MAAENRTSRAGRAGGADLRNHPKVRRVYVAAKTYERAAQAARDSGLSLDQLRVVRSVHDILGLDPRGMTLHRLSGWWKSGTDTQEAVELWIARGGSFRDVPEGTAIVPMIHPTVAKLAEELAEVADETLTSEGSHKAYEAEMAKLRHEFELRLQLFLEACRRSFDVD